MKSLPRIVKEPEKNQDIKPFDFFAGFKIKEDVQTEEQEDGNDGPIRTLWLKQKMKFWKRQEERQARSCLMQENRQNIFGSRDMTRA